MAEYVGQCTYHLFEFVFLYELRLLVLLTRASFLFDGVDLRPLRVRQFVLRENDRIFRLDWKYRTSTVRNVTGNCALKGYAALYVTETFASRLSACTSCAFAFAS